VIWRLFKRSSSHKLRHLLCHGFERSGTAYRQPNVEKHDTSSIPGLLARFPNNYVHTLKGPLWCRLHAVLGEGGDRIMMDMLTDCAIFRPVNGERGNYYQLSGPPISDLELGHVPKEITSEAALAKPAFQQY
jgi:telomerase reverse transcriptase